MVFTILKEILSIFGEDYNYRVLRSYFKAFNIYFMLLLHLWLLLVISPEEHKLLLILYYYSFGWFL